MIIITSTLVLIISTFLPISSSQKSPYRRPCALSDLRCIRYELSQNSNCDPDVWGYVTNEIQVPNPDRKVLEAPDFNATMVDQYTIYKNLDECYVSAFFFNTEKNRLVLAITCPNIFGRSHRGVIQHYPLKQNEFYSYHVQGSYPPVIFTVDLPHADQIDICDAFIYGYLTGLPEYTLTGDNPLSTRYKNRDGNGILDRLSIYEREEISQRSGYIFRYWVNNVICNFNDYCTN